MPQLHSRSWSCGASSSCKLALPHTWECPRPRSGRVLRRAGLSRLGDLQPQPVRRYERESLGELLHIDIKKLGRFDKVGHRMTGDRTQRTRNIGWEHLFVAIDDHSRIAFTQLYADEKKERRAQSRFRRPLGIASPRFVCRSGPSSQTTARPSVQPSSARPASRWASRRSSPGRSAHRPMAGLPGVDYRELRCDAVTGHSGAN